MTAESRRRRHVGRGRHRRPRPATIVKRRRVLQVALLFVLGSLAGTAAWAYWGASATAGGSGVAGVASVNAPSAPGAVVGGSQAVTVTWPQTVLSDGAPASGYVVKRYDAGTNALQATGAGCSGTVAALTCTEAAVPLGNWKYSITPKYSTNWQGSESAKSASITVGTSVLTLTQSVFGAPLPKATTGTLTGFQPSEGITYRLDAATAISGSPAIATAGGGASITGLTIPAGTADGAHVVYAVGGSGSLASFNIVVDTTAPVANAAVLSPAANGNNWNNSTPVSVTMSGTDIGGSGVSQIRYTTDGTDPTSSGTAQTYSTPLSTASNTTVKYYVIDVAGNASAVQTKTISIDPTTPVNAITVNTVTGNALKTGNTIYYRGAAAGSVTLTNTLSDAGGSGPASSGTAALSGTTTGFSHSSSTVSTPAGGPYVSNALSWTPGTTASPTETVTGTDTAGNTVTTTLTFVDDSTGPTGGSVDATGLVGTGSRYSTSTTLSIAMSKGTDSNGVPATGATLTRATATLTSGTCGSYGSYALVTGGTDPASPKSDTVTDQACYRYQYTVPDAVGNTTSYTSSDIKVDTTAPAAPTLTFSTFTNTYASGTTVYYRSATTSGSFTTTAYGTDAASGVASYSFPALGANWTSTPGTFDVNTYSWSGAPAAPGAKTVTATNNAAATSPTSTFTMTIDNTAPSGGSISYASAYVSSQSVAITFTNGTDGGSGVGAVSNVIQRASATLANGTCGGYGTFSTIATGPTSPYSDTSVTNGSCYKYQYVQYDNVGNSTPYTSANVVKVDYATAVSNTAGAVSQWRLGERLPVDSFTGTAGTNLTSHPDDNGNTWTQHSTTAGTIVLTDANRIRKNGTQDAAAYTSALPGSPDYAVEADLWGVTPLSGTHDSAGVEGRLIDNNNFYYTFYNVDTSQWQLWKRVGGTNTQIGTNYNIVINALQSYRIRLEMIGTAIKLYIDGVQRISAVDSALTAAGHAGVRFGISTTTSSPTNTTSVHLDNFTMTQMPAADSVGTNDGVYMSSPTLGVTGAIYNDSDTAVSFDGTTNYVTVPDAATLDLTDGPLSIEAWVKRADNATGTQTILQKGAGAYQLAFKNNILGLYKYGTATAIAQASSTLLDTTTFHHVVATKNGATTKIYIDGVDVTTAGTNVALVNTATALIIGGSSGEWFHGTLDEIAIYSQVLSATTVSDHYNLGNPDVVGPVGGSVDATGLVGTASRYASTGSLSIALAKGTDARTGLAAAGATVSRATATLSSAAGTADGSCGVYGSYNTIATDPATPMADTVTAQACYKYKYAVADNAGNVTTYTSGDIKIDATAPSTPNFGYSANTNTYANAGNLYYRSGATSGSVTVTASATDADSGIASYSFPALGANWTSTPGATGVNTYSWSGSPTAASGAKSVTATNNAAITGSAATFTPVADSTAPTGGSISYTDGPYPSASAAITFNAGSDTGSGVSSSAGLLQRASATYNTSTATCGSYGAFGTIATGPSSPYTDNTVAAGNCYMYQYVPVDNVGNVGTAYTSVNIAKFNSYSSMVLATGGVVSLWRLGEAAGTTVTDTEPTSPNNGTYFNTPTFSATGALSAETNTAVTFNGTNQYATVARQIQDDYSIEFFFKSTAGKVTASTSWNQGSGMVDADSTGTKDDFGISLRSDGVIMAGNGATGGTDVTLLSPTGYNDGNWHHVVFTRVKASGAITLYVDGVSVASGTGNTTSETSPTTITFGRINGATNYFAGTLDEVAIYNSALNATTVSNHYTRR